MSLQMFQGVNMLILMGILALVLIGYVLLVARNQDQDPVRKLEEEIKKARKTEEEIGVRILAAIFTDGRSRDFVILHDHLPWGRGYQITLKHCSDDWPRALVIVIDSSLPPEEQLGVGTMNFNFDHYPATEDGVRDAVSNAWSYMEMAPLSRC